MEFDAECQKDYFEINKRKYCGVQTGLILRVPFLINIPFEMRFHSDNSIQSSGFNLRVRQLDQQATTARKLSFSCCLLQFIVQ